MSDASPTPLLTLLIGARNDGYMGNFAWRLETCLNFLGENLSAIGRRDDVEVLICDWNSPAAPVHDIIYLRPAIASITRFIIVPSDVAIPLQKDSTFPIPVVQNIAIRRARGTYIAQTDSDILFTKEALTHLFQVLDGKSTLDVDPAGSLLVASRRHVPWEFASAEPSVEEMEAYLNRSGNDVPLEKLMPGFATPSSLAMLHRDVWAACRGYDERLVNWGWMEIDLYLRLCQRHPWRDLASQGVVLFHLEHYPNNNRSATPRKMNPMDISSRYDTADENWGHPDIQLQIVAATTRQRPKATARALPKTRNEILAGAVSAETKELLMKCAKHFPQPPNAATNTPAHAQLLAVTTWLARTLQPRSFLCFANGRTDLVAIVATIMPVCSIYISECSAKNYFDLKPYLQVLHSTGHKGHAQYLGGNSPDILTRSSAITASQRPDLIYLDLKDATVPAADLVHEATSLVGATGAVLFRADSAQMRNLTPSSQCNVVDLGNNLGLISCHPF